MKKLFSILTILALSLSLSAQVNKVYNFTGVSGSHATKDSVSNAASDTMYIQSQHYAETVSIQPLIATVSGGDTASIFLEASLNNTNWIQVGSDSIHRVTSTNNSAVWVITNNPYNYYRIRTKCKSTGGGAMKLYVKGYFMPNMQSGLTVGTYNMLSAYGKVTDTVTNTGVNTLLIKVNNWYKTVSIQAIVHKVSGTAAGTVTLQGSNDGLNFVTVNTLYLTTLVPYFTTGAAATLSCSNVTDQSSIFTLIGSPYEYYRLSYTGSGTMVCTLKGVVLPSK